MPNCGRALAAFSAAASLFVLAVAVSAQQPAKGKEEKKPDKAQQAEVQVLVKAVDQVVAGQQAPNDIPFTFENHFMKARDAKTYVPYILTIDPAKVTNPALAVYLRVDKKAGAAAAPATPPAKDAKKDARPEYPFEDIYFVDLTKPEAGQPYRVQRAFSVPGGDYDVYIALKERGPQNPKDKNAPPAKMSVFTKAVTVPDYYNGQLSTSSVILADKVDQLTTPYTEAEQAQHPYTFGTTQIVPSLDNKFSKKENLAVIFLVYNAAVDANKKPDVSIEYNFYLKNPDGTEKFFNKTNPQAFNAGTLPPQFDQSAGHQLVAGQEVPLASFPEGTYRLEIKVTDKLATKNLTENVAFTVTAG